MNKPSCIFSISSILLTGKDSIGSISQSLEAAYCRKRDHQPVNAKRFKLLASKSGVGLKYWNAIFENLASRHDDYDVFMQPLRINEQAAA